MSKTDYYEVMDDSNMTVIEHFIVGVLIALTATFIIKVVKWITQKPYNPKNDKFITHQEYNRLRGRHAFYSSLVLIILLVSWNEWIGPLNSKLFINDNIDKLIHGNSWVTYDPSTFHPIFNPSPGIDSLNEDLEEIKHAGFSGVITFSSRHSLIQRPEK